MINTPAEAGEAYKQKAARLPGGFLFLRGLETDSVQGSLELDAI